MMIQARTARPTRNRTWAFSFLLAAVVAAMLLLAAKPAHAATTFTVNSTGNHRDTDTTDNRCRTGFAVIGVGELCTLRAAIQEANATAGADTIKFNISGSGVKTIKPRSALPAITETVTIDGYTQPGASPNTKTRGNDAVLLIELDGENAGFARDGLYIRASNSVVRGLIINRFDGSGIFIFGDGNKVEGNFLGTDPAGTIDRGNGSSGVAIVDVSNNVVGGTSPDKRNLISGNEGSGVTIARSEATGNKVQGNYIGTTKDGTRALGNWSGVGISGSKNTVGGGAAAANTIAFNRLDEGVIGVGVGIGIIDDFSGAATGNRILSNSIFSNEDLGIDLNFDGLTLNDQGDGDTGPNTLQNFPVITSATTSSSGKTTIGGRLNSTPEKTFTIRFFSNPKGNEGKTFIGQKSVTTNAKGSMSFTFTPARTVAVGRTITATATSSGGDTSEFSAPRKVVQG